MHIETKPSDNENSSTTCTQVCGREESGRSCARFVLVKVSHHSNPNKELTTYAVLDDQSTDVFISDTLLDQLEVDAPEVDLQVNTIVGSNTIRTKKVAGLFIQDMEMSIHQSKSLSRTHESTFLHLTRILPRPV